MIMGAVRTVKDAREYNLAQGTREAPEVVLNLFSASHEASPVVPPTSGLMTLIVKYAAASQRLYSQGSDGRAPYERSTGHRHSPATAELGESIWWVPLPKSSNKLPPLGARFEG